MSRLYLVTQSALCKERKGVKPFYCATLFLKTECLKKDIEKVYREALYDHCPKDDGWKEHLVMVRAIPRARFMAFIENTAERCYMVMRRALLRERGVLKRDHCVSTFLKASSKEDAIRQYRKPLYAQCPKNEGWEQYVVTARCISREQLKKHIEGVDE